MFKFAVVIATVAVSASLAGNVPDTKDLHTASTNHVIGHKTHQPEKIMFVSEMPQESHNIFGDLLDSKLLGLLEAISIPKKIASSVVQFIVRQIKSVDVKKLLKTTALGALVIGLGSLATTALAGLASLVSFVCTVLPYLTTYVFGGLGHGQQSDYQSHIDAVSDYAYNAFNQYDAHYKA